MSTTDKATPRPWRDMSEDAGFIYSAEGDPVVAVYSSHRVDKDEARANAALIVRAVNNIDAALELLEKARLALDALNTHYALADDIDALLASARGEAQG